MRAREQAGSRHPCTPCDVIFALIVSVGPLALISTFSTVPWWLAAGYGSLVTAKWFIDTRP